MGLASVLYGKAPPPLRTAFASARGVQLQAWRYGPRFDELVREVAIRDRWTGSEWEAYARRRLQVVLAAAAAAPGHRRRGGGELSEWPLLAKDAVRAEPHAFLVPGARRRLLFEEHTSGTTGTPLTLWMSRRALRSWYALFEQRARRWNGVTRRDRWAIIGGQLVTPVDQREPPFWVWNHAGRQLYLSAFHISVRNAAAYRDALARSGVRYLLGYPSSLAALADVAAEAGVALPGVELVLTNAEPLLEYQRARIEAAFGCPVRNTYGMSEAVGGATECEEGVLHLWPDAGVVEVVADDRDEPVGDGEVGRLVFTGLLNEAMPLVRYVCGDRGSIRAAGCPCGRTLPVLERIEGRSDDVVVTVDGRRIGRLDGLFKADLPLREAQIVQHDVDDFEIVVAAGSSDAKRLLEAELPARLRERVGDVAVRVRFVDAIPRTPAGKFRAVVSHVPA